MTCARTRLLDAMHMTQKCRIEILDASDRSGTYVRTWLIDATRNSNQWRVTWDSIKRHAKSFIGRPGIEYKECDTEGHCERVHVNDGTKDGTLKKQEPYRVSTITDVELDESTQTAYAIHRIDSPEFAERLKSGQIRYLSPAIHVDHEKTMFTHNTHTGEFGIDTTGWTGLHDAWVDVPAYGPKAVVKGICDGTGPSCTEKFGRSPAGAEGNSIMLANAIDMNRTVRLLADIVPINPVM